LRQFLLGCYLIVVDFPELRNLADKRGERVEDG